MKAKINYIDKTNHPFNGHYIDFERIPQCGEIINIGNINWLQVEKIVNELVGWEWSYIIFVKQCKPVI